MPESIKVTVMGGGDHTVDYTVGKTIKQYLEELGIELEDGQSVSVNGNTVEDLDAVTSPEVNIVVASRSGNG